MSWTIPHATVPSVREGDRGIAVWAIQKGLDDLPGIRCVPDGIAGPATRGAILAFQRGHKLSDDGAAGPVTQHRLAEVLLAAFAPVGLPRGLLDGFAEMEGGWLLTAVNASVAGGIDCGLLQRRVYEADYGADGVVERAFDTREQVRQLGGSVLDLRAVYASRAGARDGYGGMGVREKSSRLAALFHNYQLAADTLSRTPIKRLAASWTRPASWVIAATTWRDQRGVEHRVAFPDGKTVDTPLEWCHLYAGVLAGAHGHHGNVTRYVTRW